LSVESIYSIRERIDINGIVQGVGFRSFIYQLALKYHLSGFVLNSSDGVTIEIEGNRGDIDSFWDILRSSPPPLCRIDTISISKIKLQQSDQFLIKESNSSSDIATMVSADIATCDECLAEMYDPKDRRYLYPFINCTNCGPRYSIIESLPYDRVHTSMDKFDMCDECHKEYTDPTNRRYHAQPISCYKCGPRLHIDEDSNDPQELIKRAVESIKDGEIVAIKGLGGFHIVCDATNEEVVSRRPIVLVQKQSESILAKSISPHIDTIGVFLPYTPLHRLLLDILDRPIVATSANLKDEPIIKDDTKLRDKLSSILSLSLTHDRRIVNLCDDSVVMSIDDGSVFLRLSRGYAPKSLPSRSKNSRVILAVGANQKSTITIAFGDHMIISPHIGDLNSIESIEYFQKSIDRFVSLYNLDIDTIVCDRHPEYESRKWAERYSSHNPKVELIYLQHHYAHALSVMAEYRLDEEILAFCFDGTGYGDDGNIWGGEVLIASPQEYRRVHHLKEFRLLGGDRAIKDPKRVALSLLFDLFQKEQILQMGIKVVESFSPKEIDTLYAMHQRGMNSPKCTSMGRLFDAVYALGGNYKELGYEGESGAIMQTQASTIESTESYPYSIDGEDIDIKDMVLQILEESSSAVVASKFINTIVDMIVDISSRYPHLPVVLSGGVFQNRLLLHKVTKALKESNQRYYIQHQTPINDGSISLGQAYYAINIEDKRR